MSTDTPVRKTIKETGGLLGAQLVGAVAEAVGRLVSSSIPPFLLVLVGGILTLAAAPALLRWKLVPSVRRWVVVVVAILGLGLWSLASSVFAWRMDVDLPATMFAEPESAETLKLAAVNPVTDSRYNRIKILGVPEVAVDASGRHVLLAFRWTVYDSGLLALLGERTYEGRVSLLASVRRTARDSSTYDPFQLVEYSGEPTKGNWAYLIGWIDIPNIMRESHFLTDWVDNKLRGGTGH